MIGVRKVRPGRKVGRVQRVRGASLVLLASLVRGAYRASRVQRVRGANGARKGPVANVAQKDQQGRRAILGKMELMGCRVSRVIRASELIRLGHMQHWARWRLRARQARLLANLASHWLLAICTGGIRQMSGGKIKANRPECRGQRAIEVRKARRVIGARRVCMAIEVRKARRVIGARRVCRVSEVRKARGAIEVRKACRAIEVRRVQQDRRVILGKTAMKVCKVSRANAGRKGRRARLGRGDCRVNGGLKDRQDQMVQLVRAAFKARAVLQAHKARPVLCTLSAVMS